MFIDKVLWGKFEFMTSQQVQEVTYQIASPFFHGLRFFKQAVLDNTWVELDLSTCDYNDC